MAATKLKELCKRIDFSDHGTKEKCRELLAQKFDRFQHFCNNSQQHAITCNGVCKRTQHVKPLANGCNIVGCYILRPFAHPVACCCGVDRDRMNMYGTSSAARVSPSRSHLALVFARLKNAGKCVMFSNWKSLNSCFLVPLRFSQHYC